MYTALLTSRASANASERNTQLSRRASSQWKLLGGAWRGHWPRSHVTPLWLKSATAYSHSITLKQKWVMSADFFLCVDQETNVQLSSASKNALLDYTLCQPFMGHFLLFSMKPSCFWGSRTLPKPPRRPSTISQLSCEHRWFTRTVRH